MLLFLRIVFFFWGGGHTSNQTRGDINILGGNSGEREEGERRGEERKKSKAERSQYKRRRRKEWHYNSEGKKEM